MKKVRLFEPCFLLLLGTGVFAAEPEAPVPANYVAGTLIELNDHGAWPVDIELDEQQNPCIVFSVQRDGRGLPPRQGGMDLRYYYGRWDGSRWQVNEMAYAGTRLYPFEDDYPGLAALDPKDPDVVYISTNAHPLTGAALISRADRKRHYELFRGRTRDFGFGIGDGSLFGRRELKMKKVALSKVKDDLSRYLRLAQREEIVITRHGKPAGLLIGFESEDDWFEYKLQSDPRFLARVERARQSLRAGRGVRIEELDGHN